MFYTHVLDFCTQLKCLLVLSTLDEWDVNYHRVLYNISRFQHNTLKVCRFKHFLIK